MSKKKPKQKTVKVKMHFPTGHLGASATDNALDLIVRALSLKHGKKDEWADKYGTDYEDDVIRIHPAYQDGDCTCAYEVEEKKWLADNPHSAECFVAVAGKLVADIEKQHPVPDFNMFYEMDDVDAAEFVQFWHGGEGPTEEQKARKKAKQDKHEADRLAWSAAYEVQTAAIRAAVIAEAEQFNIPVDRRKEYRPYIEGALVAKDAESMWEFHCTCGQSDRHEAWEKAHDHVRPCWHWWAGEPNFWHKPTDIKVRWYKYIGRDTEVKPNPIPADKWKQLVKLVSKKDLNAVIKKGYEASKAFADMIALANQRSAEMARQ